MQSFYILIKKQIREDNNIISQCYQVYIKEKKDIIQSKCQASDSEFTIVIAHQGVLNRSLFIVSLINLFNDSSALKSFS